MTGSLLLGLVVGLVVGAGVASALALLRRSVLAAELRTTQGHVAEARAAESARAREVADLQTEVAATRAQAARLTTDAAVLQRTLDEREARREEDEQRMAGALREISQQALRDNNDQFLALADERFQKAQVVATGELTRRQVAIEQMLKPLHQTLSRYQEGLRQLELDRKEAYTQLTTQVGTLGTTQEQLQRETRNLVAALRSPQTRGRWGEIQLRRVVELAGMVAHCDFTEQLTVHTEDARFRPDLVVHVPGGANVVVDSKVALDAYLSAVEAEDESERLVHLASHARQLRAHVDQLAKKEYWNHFDTSPDLVVAFVPGDSLLAAASEQDPHLVEYALSHHVHLATPTTLIALLRTIAYSWRQDDMAANARQVQEMGAELYDRLRVMGGHLSKLHRNLSGTVEAFNETVGSLESRVLVSARRFADLGVGVGGKEIPETLPVTAAPRLLQAPELMAAVDHEARADGEGRRALEELPAESDSVIRRLTGSA